MLWGACPTCRRRRRVGIIGIRPREPGIRRRTGSPDRHHSLHIRGEILKILCLEQVLRGALGAQTIEKEYCG